MVTLGGVSQLRLGGMSSRPFVLLVGSDARTMVMLERHGDPNSNLAQIPVFQIGSERSLDNGCTLRRGIMI
jgi:hypothetical protein